jgi:hypothetical protein
LIGIIVGVAFAVVFLVLVAYAGISLWRNARVYRYRVALCDQVYRLNVDDIHRGIFHTCDERWRISQSADYDEMVRKFWVPLDDFYPDKDFLLPGDQWPAQDYFIPTGWIVQDSPPPEDTTHAEIASHAGAVRERHPMEYQ